MIQVAATTAVWADVQTQAQKLVATEPVLASFIQKTVLDNATLADSLAFILANHIADATITEVTLRALLQSIYIESPDLGDAAAADLAATVARDPAEPKTLTPFLYFKGFHALQTHRAAHFLWECGRRDLACFLQHRTSLLYGVDIHPAARMGRGIFIDHATGIVIGATAVVEDDVSMLHGVTLGGTGIRNIDRHPKVRRGVLIGAGSTILGNIEIGQGSTVAAGSVVLKPVPAGVTVAGVPAQIVGKPKSSVPSEEMDQTLPEE
jgi:serine O-acetyltransferase